MHERRGGCHVSWQHPFVRGSRGGIGLAQALLGERIGGGEAGHGDADA